MPSGRNIVPWCPIKETFELDLFCWVWTFEPLILIVTFPFSSRKPGDTPVSYPPWNWHRPWKWMVGRLVSFCECLFSVSNLLLRAVCVTKAPCIHRKTNIPAGCGSGPCLWRQSLGGLFLARKTQFDGNSKVVNQHTERQNTPNESHLYYQRAFWKGFRIHSWGWAGDCRNGCAISGCVLICGEILCDDVIPKATPSWKPLMSHQPTPKKKYQ